MHSAATLDQLACNLQLGVIAGSSLMSAVQLSAPHPDAMSYIFAVADLLLRCWHALMHLCSSCSDVSKAMRKTNLALVTTTIRVVGYVNRCNQLQQVLPGPISKWLKVLSQPWEGDVTMVLPSTYSQIKKAVTNPSKRDLQIACLQVLLSNPLFCSTTLPLCYIDML